MIANIINFVGEVIDIIIIIPSIHMLHFLKLYKLSKDAHMNPEHVVNLLQISNEYLPLLEQKYKKLTKEIDSLESEKQKSEQIGSQVRILAKMLEDYNQQIKELHRKKIGLEGLVREFENNEIYKKIRLTAEEEVNNTLSKRKDLLKLAVSSVIESIRRDPTKYNFIINSNPYQDGQHMAFIDVYRALILDGAQRIFEVMAKDLTSRIINEMGFDNSSSNLMIDDSQFIPNSRSDIIHLFSQSQRTKSRNS